jgi:crossover junction endodeoxyribonuclease RuvC
MTVILGVDSSLTGTGLARLNTAHPAQPWAVHRLKTNAPTVASHDATHRRIIGIAKGITHFANGDPDLVVMEAPAYSSITGRVHERAGLWWLTYDHMREEFGTDVPVLVVEPNVRIKYATGNGRSGKDEVMIAAVKRYPAAEITNNDEADAVILAAMGARLMGEPVEQRLAKNQLDAMKTLALPPRRV